MTIFWILSAGLAFLAVLFVIAPLISKHAAGADIDQDQVNLTLFKDQLAELDADLAAGKLDPAEYAAAKADIERELLYDIGDTAVHPGAPLRGARWVTLGLALAVPALAVGLYLGLGNQHIIDQLQASATGSVTTPHGGGTENLPPLEVLVERLAERMEQRPEDLDGWLMLGRTYFAIKQPDKALDAMERAYGLAPENVDVLLAYAEALAANNGNRLDGKPAELISEALKIDPGNASARWLSGVLAFQRGQYNAALVAWKAVLAQLDPNGAEATELRSLIAQAQQRAGVPPDTVRVAQTESMPEPAGDDPSASGSAPPAAGATTGQDAIEVSVSLEPELADRANPSDTLFIYAKAASGPPMPLAVQRATVADLPITVTLDDSMAMMPAMKLSKFPQVIVGARISRGGQAMPQSGDIEGETGPIQAADNRSVAVQINRIRP